ncbi:hypothetical protein CRUP_038757 [Coryphaenoides rupestris]|nr:hypothetical protein CRUP_038757 [Coryphaenoides rupestris]
MSQPPVLTEFPTSFTAFYPDDIYLPCQATGLPKPTFRWVKDGTQFGPERRGEGTLVAGPEENIKDYAGDYRCYASNVLGTAVTNTVRLITESRPVLPKQRRLREKIKEGESMVLHCNPPASSTARYIYWMDTNLVHIKQSERVVVGLDGNMYFANVRPIDTRDDYVCHAHYPVARTILPQEGIALTVTASNDVVSNKKPQLFSHTKPHSAVLALRGHSLVLECIPSGWPTPTVEWHKKDGNLKQASARMEKFDRWLNFASITQTDDGVYECRASNVLGVATHSFTVTVEEEPYWVETPQSLLYTPGESVRLHCQADGIPTPTITWSINGQPITDVDKEPRWTVRHGVFILREAVLADTAVYQCEATNAHGSILHNAYIYVAVLPPQILSSDGVVYHVTEGKDIQMKCETFGSPLPHITWERDGAMSLLTEVRASLLTNGTLVLSAVSEEDAGTYTCSVQNTNIAINAHLVIHNRTVIQSGPQHLRPVRGSDALFDCIFWKDPQLSDAQVVWKKKGHKLQEATNKYTVFSNHTLKVAKVQSDDSGEYSCDVITMVDHVEATGSITVVAPPDPPKALSLSEIRERSLTLSWVPGHSHNSPITVPDSNPRNVSSQSTDPGTLVITWDEVDKQLHNGQGYKYKVFWRQGQTGHWNHSYAERPPFLVNGTGTYTPFEIKVQGVNSLGDGPQPITKTGHSGEDVPQEAPGDVDVVIINSTVRVSWAEPERVQGQLLGYKKGGGEAEEDSRVVWVNGTHTSQEVTGLRYYSRYELSVTAFNSKGESPASAPYVLSTPEGDAKNLSEKVVMLRPDADHHKLLDLNATSNYNFWLMARTAAGRGPALKGKGHPLLDGGWAKWEESELVNSTQGFYTLGDLQPGTQYHLAIIHNNVTTWNYVVDTNVPVKDKEDGQVDSEARPMKDETFGEYSQPSLCADSKMGSDDSLAEYGDSVDIQFNEDGSFIGQYSGRVAAPHGNESSGPASPVNGVPAPPVGPSMSTVLNRPS